LAANFSRWWSCGSCVCLWIGQALIDLADHEMQYTIACFLLRLNGFDIFPEHVWVIFPPASLRVSWMLLFVKLELFGQRASWFGRQEEPGGSEYL
jgi:hypothetical protein